MNFYIKKKKLLLHGPNTFAGRFFCESALNMKLWNAGIRIRDHLLWNEEDFKSIKMQENEIEDNQSFLSSSEWNLSWAYHWPRRGEHGDEGAWMKTTEVPGYGTNSWNVLWIISSYPLSLCPRSPKIQKMRHFDSIMQFNYCMPYDLLCYWIFEHPSITENYWRHLYTGGHSRLPHDSPWPFGLAVDWFRCSM